MSEEEKNPSQVHEFGPDTPKYDLDFENGLQRLTVSYDFWAPNNPEDYPVFDDNIRDLLVLLPPSYSDAYTRFPVVFMLPGYTGTNESYFAGNPWNETLEDQLWEPMEDNDIRQMIIVCPDCWSKYGGSQYINSEGTGNYQDYLLELVKFVDWMFRTIPDKHHRAIVGHSSGGFGAMRMGMAHPDVFGHVADHAGDKGFEFVYKPEFPEFLRAFDRVGKDGFKKILEEPMKAKKNKDFFTLMHMAAMGLCYSPNKEAEFGFDFPMTLDTCSTTEAWEKWLKNDPLYMINHASTIKDRESLRSLDTLYMDCGKYDEYNLLYGCRRFFKSLTESGIAPTYMEFDGGHRGNSDRYLVSLKQIGEEMSEFDSNEEVDKQT